MKYEILGSAICNRLLALMRGDTSIDLSGASVDGIRAYAYSMLEGGGSASALHCDDSGEVVVVYQKIGAIPYGVKRADVRAQLKRSDGVIAFFTKNNERIVSAITYRGAVDVEEVRKLALRCAEVQRERDSQRNQVYKLGDLYTRRMGTLTAKQAKALCNQIVRDYKLPAKAFDVDFTERYQRTMGKCFTLPFDALRAQPAFTVIHCERATRTIDGISLDTLLHEWAHGIAPYEFLTNVEAHGGEFVALYLELLVKYGPQFGKTIDVTEFLENCKRLGVRIDRSNLCIDGVFDPPFAVETKTKRAPKRTNAKRRKADL